jgi:hypothetical protein
MKYIDKILVLLVSETTRADIFDDTALENILSATYDEPSAEGPYSAIFNDLELGYAVPQRGTAEGLWSLVGTGQRHEAMFYLSGLGEARQLAAFWRGSIVARIRPATDRIIAVDYQSAHIGQIDDAIMDDLGSLPADAETLETERRDRLTTILQNQADDPDAFTSVHLDRWLARIGATSVGEVIEQHQKGDHSGVLTLQFEAPSDEPPVPRQFPVSAAIFIRDVGFSVMDLLHETRDVIGRLSAIGDERPAANGLRRKRSITAIWILPEVVFDDEDWPGASNGMSADARRDARRQVASDWLAREGIGLVVPSET